MNVETEERNQIYEETEVTKDLLDQRLQELFKNLCVNDSHLDKPFQGLNHEDIKAFQIEADRKIFLENRIDKNLYTTLFNNQSTAHLLISMINDKANQRMILAIRNSKPVASGQCITIISEESSDELIVRNDPVNYPVIGLEYKPKNLNTQLGDSFALVRTVETIARQNNLISQ
jgi:hypothetical protein